MVKKYKVIIIFVLIEIAFLIFAFCMLNVDNQPKEMYTAAFVTNGGTWEDGTSRCKIVEYDIDTELTVPMKMTRVGYIFIGWHTIEISGNWEEAKIYNNIDTTILEGCNGMYGEVIFCAKWEKTS